MPPFTGQGNLGGSELLDQPPPSPAISGATPGVNPGPAPMSAMAPPLAASQIPPDVLTGMLKVTEKMDQDLRALAQMTPDLAMYWQSVSEALAVAMSQVLMAGGGPTSPTNTGPGFPGGGLDRGGMPLASGGPA